MGNRSLASVVATILINSANSTFHYTLARQFYMKRVGYPTKESLRNYKILVSRRERDRYGLCKRKTAAHTNNKSMHEKFCTHQIA